jgi:hypothetical protein
MTGTPYVVLFSSVLHDAIQMRARGGKSPELPFSGPNEYDGLSAEFYDLAAIHGKVIDRAPADRIQVRLRDARRCQEPEYGVENTTKPSQDSACERDVEELPSRILHGQI